MVILFTFLSTFHTGIHYLLEKIYLFNFVHIVFFSAGHSKQIDAYRINLVGSI